MNQLIKTIKYNEKMFKNVKHMDKYGNEYWEAR